MSNLKEYSRSPDKATHSRAVGLPVALALVMGNVVSVVGWLVLGISMIFVWVFVAQSELVTMLTFRGEVKKAQGRVVATSATNMSEGGSDTSPGTPIFRVDFEYEPFTGLQRTDTCYVLGSRFSAGQSVAVEYVATDPPQARIEGTRRQPFDAWVAFVLLFPLAGLALIVLPWWAGLRSLGLATRGRVAQGRLIGKEATNMQINNRYVFKLTFEFMDQKNVLRQATIRTHHVEKVQDQPMERLLYDPVDPTKVRMVDLLPRGIQVSEDGSIQVKTPGRYLLMAFVPPLLVIGVHALVGWMMFG